MRCILRVRPLVILALYLLGICTAAVAAEDTREVPWLEEVITAPSSPAQEPVANLAPLLVDAAGEQITTRDQWEGRRQHLHAAWRKLLGPMPNERPAIELTVLRTDELPGLTRQLVQYESEPGLKVEGYLLRPTDIRPAEQRAALVALHATTADTIDRIAGLTGDPTRQLGLQLAQRGFVVFCPRCFLWQNGTDFEQAVANFRQRHPETLGMHKMLHDASRAVDVLESLTYVDRQRIGAVGHSLGAKETLYLAAFDPRIKAAVASEGGLRLQSTNWDAPWYLGPRIHEAGFARDHHELLALIAPRPFLILAGESGRGAADSDLNWPYLRAAQPVYRLYDQPVRLGMFNHRQGHSIGPQAFSRMAQWLETYLQLSQSQ
jgi:dienelactone hydrolase